MISLSPRSFDEVLDWICAIQQIPAPTFQEQERAAYLFEEFKRLGYSLVEQDAAGNILARWAGGPGKALLVSAHLDTVHRDLKGLPIDRAGNRITGPGVADNSTGLAALLMLARHLSEVQPQYPGDIWLAADVCEEGLGNLAGMRALVDRFSDQVFAYLILEGLGLGQVCHRGLGVNRFQVTAETAGGHSWVDFGAPSAIHELAKVVAELADLSLPEKPRSSLNVGVIQGGTSINTIASRAHFLLDLRAEDQLTLLRVCDRAKQSILSHQKTDVKIVIEQIGMRPAGEIPGEHPLVLLGRDVLNQLKTQSALEIGSTDANIPLSRGYPAICIGLTRGNFPHTLREYIEVEPLKIGLAQLLMLVDQVWRIS
ncbi:MAG: M20/M25/M40 family metallo-hydrolase [Bellilinea sp.]